MGRGCAQPHGEPDVRRRIVPIMTSSTTGSHALISIDDQSIPLSPDEDIGALRHRIQAAADHPQFVELISANGTELSFFMSIARRVTIAIIPPGRDVPDAPPVAELASLGFLDF